MQATITSTERRNAKNLAGTKETVRNWTLVAFADGAFSEPITVCWYMARRSDASVVYCSIWLHGQGSGHGSAGGGGYDKYSAALGDAIASAGIALDKDIRGRGESACREALEAIADAMGIGPQRHIVT